MHYYYHAVCVQGAPGKAQALPSTATSTTHMGVALLHGYRFQASGLQVWEERTGLGHGVASFAIHGFKCKVAVKKGKPRGPGCHRTYSHRADVRSDA